MKYKTLKYLKLKYGIQARLHSKRLVDWAYSVKYRDEFTCRHCGVKEGGDRYLQAHHIKSKKEYPELKYDISNGITLCNICHAKVEGRYKDLNKSH